MCVMYVATYTIQRLEIRIMESLREQRLRISRKIGYARCAALGRISSP